MFKSIFKVTIVLFFIIGNFSPINLIAQETSVEPNIVPPSPTSSGLGKYGEYPVNLNTGVPQINIPIYEIKTRDLTLPISLSYHASGIKVAEEASWVGLGWSLNAGGIITRSIKGLDDYGDYGYGRNERFIDSILTTDDKDARRRAANGEIDLEPDIYYYNVNGYSGKFIYVDGVVRIIPNNDDVTINFYGSDRMGFILKDPQGITYVFGREPGTIDEKYNEFVHSTSESFTSGVGDSYPITNDNSISSWLLRKVISPHGDIISFSYDHYYSIIQNDKLQSEVKYQSLTKSLCTSNADRSTFLSTQHEGYHISKVTFNGGSLIFTIDDFLRKDVENNKALSAITLLNSFNDTIKKWNLEQAYFGNIDDFNTCRLKLLSIQEFSGAESLPPYKFSYNEFRLPPKDSKNIDFWGYSNGKINQTLVPKSEVTGYFPNEADRTSSNKFMQAGVLTQIQFPTGGTTNFQFEANSYNKTVANNKYKSTSKLEVSQGVSPEIKTESFTVNENQHVKVEYTGEDTGGHGAGLAFKIQEGNNTPKLDVSGGMTAGIDTIVYLYLTEGTYLLTADADSYLGATGSIQVSYYIANGDTTMNSIVGGLRISKMITSDSINANPDTTEYRYEFSNYSPSGYLVTDSDNDDNFEFTTKSYVPFADQQAICTQVARTSSNPCLLGASGEIVAYDEVLVKKLGHNGNDNGATRYVYLHKEDGTGNKFIQGTSYSWHRGLELEKIDYNSSGKTVKRVENKYFFDPEKFYMKIPGIYVRFLLDHPTIDDQDEFQQEYSYNLISEWVKLDSTITTNYYNGVPVVNIVNYNYDTTANHHLPIEVIETASDGTKRITRTKYPKDYSGSGSVLLNLFNIYNMINEPIEKSFWEQDANLNEYCVGAQFTSHYIENDRIFKDTIFALELEDKLSDFTPSYLDASGNLIYDDRYSPAIVFDDYDEFGNILQYHKPNGQPVSFIWGYNSSLPIAKISNASYSQIQSEVSSLQSLSNTDYNESTETNLRNALKTLQASLPDAIVSSYTFDPLVGMTSVTNERNKSTYYNYDDFERLSYISNGDKHIVKRFEYSYKGSAGGGGLDSAYLVSEIQLINLLPEADTTIINVETNLDTWTASAGCSWITPSSLSANQLRLIFTSNTTSQKRYCDIVLSGTGEYADTKDTIYVIQDSAYLNLSPDYLHFNYPGGTQPVSISTNLSSLNDTDNQSWISTDIQNTVLNVTCDYNSGSDRNGIATVAGIGDFTYLTDTVDVDQSNEPSCSVKFNPDSYTADPQGETYQASYTTTCSNIDVTYSLFTATYVSNTRIDVVIPPNNTDQPKSAWVKAKGGTDGGYDYLWITQPPIPPTCTLDVSSQDVVIAEDPESNTIIDVTTNSSSWDITATRGIAIGNVSKDIVNDEIEIDIGYNTTNDSLFGEIDVSACDITKTIYLRQGPLYIESLPDINVACSGDTIDVDIVTNLEGWNADIVPGVSREYLTSKLRIKFPPNTTQEPIEYEVSVFGITPFNDISQGFTATQAACLPDHYINCPPSVTDIDKEGETRVFSYVTDLSTIAVETSSSALICTIDQVAKTISIEFPRNNKGYTEHYCITLKGTGENSNIFCEFNASQPTIEFSATPDPVDVLLDEGTFDHELIEVTSNIEWTVTSTSNITTDIVMVDGFNGTISVGLIDETNMGSPQFVYIWDTHGNRIAIIGVNFIDYF